MGRGRPEDASRAGGGADDAGPGGETGTFASPPCFMHEVDPVHGGHSGAHDPQQATDVRRWRGAERLRLIRERLAIPADVRRRYDERIRAHLETALGPVAGLIVAAYWPIRGEPDLRPFLEYIKERGGTGALPVVTGPRAPLEFRAWAAGDPLAPGIWNIPVPPAAAPKVAPDVVVAPMVGFDRAGHRLGNGGGYYDRTLAALGRGPRALGVGYALAEVPTIFPQWHDLPMDTVITEAGPLGPSAP